MHASALQLLGSGAFGFLIGWTVYYINRHREGTVRYQDLVSLIGAIGGGAVLALFPAGSDLFGAYGLGLLAGFLCYFVVLALLVRRSPDFDVNYFIDGRRRAPQPDQTIPRQPDQGAMGGADETSGIRD